MCRQPNGMGVRCNRKAAQMNFHWLLRMSRWARNPPSPGRVKLVIGVVVLCLILLGIEHFIGWPDILSVEPGRRFRP